jgi:prepilin-type N-terminal cleavage/methylation domain-containing protein
MRDHRRRSTRPRPGPRPSGRGFTLTELLVVIAIIGILVAFILIAAGDGIRRAEEKATQSLIAKLEVGLSERMEAILLTRADIGLGHHAMAAVVNGSLTTSNDPATAAKMNTYFNVTNYTGSLLSFQRAQTIAQIDMVRAQLPDVFFDQRKINPAFGKLYPINFCGLDFPIGSGNFLVPLGAFSNGTPPGQPGASSLAPGDPNLAIGIFGATWQAAGGIYKNLGYLPQGYDGADNNNDGFVDDYNEGVGNNTTISDPDNPSASVTLDQLVQRRLNLHQHNTARSEMLYALLVEGVGPMGSVFNRDEFTNKQVQDTDNDGLPEFIDAWGHPLQFFRWPIFYNNLSNTSLTASATGYVQKGADPYYGLSEPRQVDSLDPNQTLVALPWWMSSVNTGTDLGAAGGNGQSGREQLFEIYFHRLTDPNINAGLGTGQLWDRGGLARRAFYSRPLIVSSGPDETLGVYVAATLPPPPIPTPPPGTPTTLSSIQQWVTYFTGIENPAGAYNPIASTDDISNQAMGSPTGGVR